MGYLDGFVSKRDIGETVMAVARMPFANRCLVKAIFVASSIPITR